MYSFERLSDEVHIATSRKHTFGTDALLLSYFAKPKARDIAIDMGTGCGIIPLLWLRKEYPKTVHCLDIQKNAYEQVKCSYRV